MGQETDQHERLHALPDETATPDGGGPEAPGSMAGHVGQGMVWLILNIGFSKVFILAAQVVLGWQLSKAQFGLYAISIAVTSVVTVFKDGGIRELLVQRQREYRDLVGQVFWMAVAVNIVAGGILAALAPLTVWYFGDQLSAEDAKALFWMIIVTAIWIPVSSTYAIQYIKLKIDLRFKAIAWIGLASGIIRYGGQVVLALSGFGAMSFVLPLLAVAVWEAVIGYIVTREAPWQFPAHVRQWPGLLREVRWILLGNLMMGGLGQSYYLVIGRVVPLEVVGVFFFGLQLLLHVESVIGFNMQQVLPTVYTRFKHDHERLGSAALRTIRACSMITAPAAIGLAVVFPALQELVRVWDGKWAVAATPLAILAVGYPLRMLLVGVSSVLVQSQGRWSDWAWLWTFNSIGITVVAGTAGAIGKTPEAIAWAVSGFMFVTGLYSCCREMGRLGVGAATVVPACLLALAVGLVVGAGSLWLELRWLAESHAVVRFGAAAAVFGGAYTIAVRVLLPSHLAESLAIAPAMIAGRAARLLLLKPPART